MTRVFWSVTLLLLFFASVWTTPDSLGYLASTAWSAVCGALYGTGARWLAGVKPLTAALLAFAVTIALPTAALAVFGATRGEPWFADLFRLIANGPHPYPLPLLAVELLIPVAATFIAATFVSPRGSGAAKPPKAQ